MAIKLGEVIVSVAGEFAGFISDFTRLGKHVAEQVDGMKGQIESLHGAIESVQGTVRHLMEAFAVKEIVEFGERMIEATAHIKLQAEAAGVTTQAYQALQYAASQTGVTQEGLNTALERFNKNLGLAQTGAKTQVDLFKQLGVNIRDASGQFKPTQQVFLDVAEAISHISSEAIQGKEEVALFGRGGAEMADMMKGGAEELQNLGAQAENLGLIFDKDMIEQAHKAEASIQGLKIEVQAFFEVLVAKFTPQIIEVIKYLAQLFHLGPEDNMTPAINDANELLKKCNETIERVKQKQKELAETTGATAAEDQKITEEYLKQEQTLKELYAIQHSLLDNLSEMGERIRDPNLKTSPFAGGTTTTGGVTIAPAITHHKKEVDEFAKSQAEAAKRIAEVENGLRLEIDALSLDSEQARLNAELYRAQVGIRSEAGQRIAAEVAELDKLKKAKEEQKKLDEEQKRILDSIPYNKYTEYVRVLKTLYDSDRISLEQYNAELKKASDAYVEATPELKQQADLQKQLQDSVENAAGAIGSDLVTALLDSQNAADRWRNLLKSILHDVMNAFNDLVKNLLKIGFDSIFGALGVGTATGGPIIGPLAGSPVVAAAGGGHLNIGDWAIVGEAGPELMYADTPGTILSADRTRGIFAGANGGGNTAYIDARGADVDAVARLEAGLAKLHYSIEHRAVAAVNATRKRGGGFAATFAR